MKRVAIIAFTLFMTSACGNGGNIIFNPEATPSESANKSSSFNVVPGSQALALEDGQPSVATGYHARRVQLNQFGGQMFTTTGNYKAVIKFTKR